MANNTPRNINGGTRGIAKREWEKKQAILRAEQAAIVNDTLLREYLMADWMFFNTLGPERRQWAIIRDTLSSML